MRMEKKQIWKEDGRYLIFYHFVESATEEQTAAYAGISESEPSPSANPIDPNAATAGHVPPHEEETRV